MDYLTAAEYAVKSKMNERVIRRKCASGLIEGAIKKDGIWLIPASTPKAKRTRSGPQEKNDITKKPKLLQKLIHQRDGSNYSGLYDYSMVNLTYSNCRMSSGRLTKEQITMIFQKDKILTYNERLKINDIIEARNHIRAFDYILDNALEPLTTEMILNLHKILLSDSCDHKRRPAIAGKYRTTEADFGRFAFSKAPEICSNLAILFRAYESRKTFALHDVLDMHVKFERIKPFDETNGRIGRLIMFKECLRHDIVPFIIDDKRRSRYLDGIRKWDEYPAVFEAVAIEAQCRYQAQIDLQILIARHHELHPEFD